MRLINYISLSQDTYRICSYIKTTVNLIKEIISLIFGKMLFIHNRHFYSAYYFISQQVVSL